MKQRMEGSVKSKMPMDDVSSKTYGHLYLSITQFLIKKISNAELALVKMLTSIKSDKRLHAPKANPK